MSRPEPAISRRTLFRAGTAMGVGAAVGTGIGSNADAAVPAVDQPYIAGCDEWGARPPSSAVTVIHNRPVKIIVHHTALANSTDYSQVHAFAMSREIQDLHMDQNGWLDTGQQFTNSRGGWITEGRHGSLDALLGGQTLIEGAQCVGQNDVSIGIENEGNYVDEDPPDVLYQSLIGLCAYICQQYGIAPAEIYGHQDYNNTQCPGRLEGRLPDLRTQVTALLSA